jgi:potassium/hydrogen antiporter
LIQGTTIGLFAKWFKVALPEKVKPLSEIDKILADFPKSSLQEFEILSGYYAANKRIVDLDFPKSAFIIMIKRGEEYIRPGGSTVIEKGDKMMVLADKESDFPEVSMCLKDARS